MRFAVLIMICLTGACSRQVQIDSIPSGARVEHAGTVLGYTPLTLHLSTNQRELNFVLAGHKDSTVILHRRFDGRSFMALLMPPLLCVPAVVTRFEAAYEIKLSPGQGQINLGVVHGDEQVPDQP